MRGFYQFARVVLVGLSYLLFRLRVRGRELVPARGAYVLAPTHRSLLDIPFAASVTRRRVRYMGKKELWGSSVGNWLFTALGGFPVDRSAGSGAVRAALSRLDDGEPVVVFPEGTRRHGSKVVDLQQGAAYLAVKRGVPLVPVGIAGSEEILASGKLLPSLQRVAIVVGPPIHPQGGTGGKRVDRDEVARLTGALEAELQRLFDEATDVLART